MLDLLEVETLLFFLFVIRLGDFTTLVLILAYPSSAGLLEICMASLTALLLLPFQLSGRGEGFSFAFILASVAEETLFSCLTWLRVTLPCIADLLRARIAILSGMPSLKKMSCSE